MGQLVGGLPSLLGASPHVGQTPAVPLQECDKKAPCVATRSAVLSGSDLRVVFAMREVLISTYIFYILYDNILYDIVYYFSHT